MGRDGDEKDLGKCVETAIEASMVLSGCLVLLNLPPLSFELDVADS